MASSDSKLLLYAADELFFLGEHGNRVRPLDFWSLQQAVLRFPGRTHSQLGAESLQPLHFAFRYLTPLRIIRPTPQEKTTLIITKLIAGFSAERRTSARSKMWRGDGYPTLLTLTAALDRLPDPVICVVVTDTDRGSWM